MKRSSAMFAGLLIGMALGFMLIGYVLHQPLPPALLFISSCCFCAWCAIWMIVFFARWRRRNSRWK